MKRKNRILTIDLLRAVFVLLIICCHFSICYLQYSIDGFHNFLLRVRNVDFGQLATVGFFVISGWALACGGGTFEPLTFLKKRYFKIFPLFYICYLMWFPFQVYLHGRILYNGNPVRFIWTLLGVDYYVGGAFPTYAIVGEWFTGAIILLYILYPMLLFLQNKWPTSTTVGLFVLYLINAYVFPVYILQGHESIAQDLFPFWCGMMLAKVNTEDLKKVSPLVFLLPLVFLAIVPSNIYLPLNTLLIVLLVIFSINIAPEAGMQKIAETRICKILNKYSYPIYLLHHQTIYLVMMPFKEKHLNPIFGLLLLVFCIILSVLEAAISCRILQLLKIWLKKR